MQTVGNTFGRKGRSKAQKTEVKAKAPQNDGTKAQKTEVKAKANDGAA